MGKSGQGAVSGIAACACLAALQQAGMQVEPCCCCCRYCCCMCLSCDARRPAATHMS